MQTAQDVHVYAAKGPLAGRFVLMPDEAAIDAATAEGGWAIKLDPGNVLLPDYDAPWDESWVIPGYTPATETPPPEPPEPEQAEPVALLSLWNTNPALALVAAADISKFANGDVVTVAGVLAPHEFVNGQQTVANVGVGGDQFELAGVDLTAAGTTIGDPGMTVTPAAAPAGRRSDERRGGKEDRSGDDRGIENRRNSAIPSGRRNRS